MGIYISYFHIFILGPILPSCATHTQIWTSTILRVYKSHTIN